jgi:hypothetical protein
MPCLSLVSVVESRSFQSPPSSPSTRTYIIPLSLLHFDPQILPKQSPQTSNLIKTPFKMCLFSTPSKKHHRHRSAYVEEVYVAPRPVSRHSHRGNGRTSYTSVTRTTSRPVSREYITTAPRMSQNSYRRSAPIVVEQRRSTRSYR